MSRQVAPEIRALLAGPLAMHPAHLDRVVKSVTAYARGEDVDLQAAFAPEARTVGRDRPVAQGVGVIQVFHTVFHRGIYRYFGCSTEALALEFDRLVDDDAIEVIVFDINSPGGTVYGVPEFAAKVFAARKRKRIISVVNPLAASAAYWIAVAAGEVVMIPSGEVGSIGVFGVHLDFSRLLEADGITPTIIRSNEHKAEGNPFEPLSEDTYEHMLAQVQTYGDAFDAAVAKYRGVSVRKVVRDFGTGRTSLAEHALEIGMVDRIGTLEDVLAEVGIDRRRQISMYTGADVAEARRATAENTAAAVERTAAVEREALSARVATPAEVAMNLLRPAGADVDGALQTTEDLRAHAGVGVITWRPEVTAGGAAPLEDDDPEDPEDDPAEPDDEPDEDPEDDADPDGDEPAASTETPETDAAPQAAKEEAMPPEDKAAQGGAATATAERPAVSAGADREAESNRAAQIAELCALHNMSDKAADYIRSGRSVADIGLEIARKARENIQAMTAPAVEMTAREAKRYSIRRAIMGQVARLEGGKPSEDDGFECEISEEIRSKLPSDYKYQGGIMVPTRIRAADARAMGMSAAGQIDPAVIQRLSVLDPVLAGRLAALDTSVASGVGGGNTVFVEGGELIDMLRPRMKVIALGATTLTGLRSPQRFPRQTGASQWTWVEENPGSDLADSDAAIGQVPLDPKMGSATTAYSRQLLIESSIDVDAFVQNDLNQIAALGIDKAAIDGPGGDAPTGILNTTGVTVVPIGTDGGVPTFAIVVQMETEVATDNADIGTLAYLTTPGIRGKLKTTEMFPGTNGMPIWMGGEMNGYRAEVSTQVPSNLTKGSGTNLHAILFGVWSQLLLGYFGAYELIVDPFAKKKQQLIEVTASQMVGTAVRNPESFAVVEDAALS